MEKTKYLKVDTKYVNNHLYYIYTEKNKRSEKYEWLIKTRNEKRECYAVWE